MRLTTLALPFVALVSLAHARWPHVSFLLPDPPCVEGPGQPPCPGEDAHESRVAENQAQQPWSTPTPHQAYPGNAGSCPNDWEAYVNHRGKDVDVRVVKWPGTESSFVLVPDVYENNTLPPVKLAAPDGREESRMIMKLNGKNHALHLVSWSVNMQAWLPMITWWPNMRGTRHFKIKDDGKIAVPWLHVWNRSWMFCPRQIDGKSYDVIMLGSPTKEGKLPGNCKKTTVLRVRCSEEKGMSNKKPSLAPAAPVLVDTTTMPKSLPPLPPPTSKPSPATMAVVSPSSSSSSSSSPPPSSRKTTSPAASASPVSRPMVTEAPAGVSAFASEPGVAYSTVTVTTEI